MTRFLGLIIEFIYNLCNNYGLAIILFTVLIKLLLLPLGIKQQKSMAKIQKLQPTINELQKKYKNDQQRLSTEMAKLYKDNNASPLGGCLPLLIQLPILFCLINVIYNPAKYILGIVEATNRNGVELAVKAGMSFDFFGIDLSVAPSSFGLPPEKLENLVYWIIPILATLATYLSGKITQKLNPQAQAQPKPGAENDPSASAAQMSKSMTAIMPLMTLFFTYSMPGTAALYWFISSATQTIQQVVLQKCIKVDDVIVPDKNKKGGKK